MKKKTRGKITPVNQWALLSCGRNLQRVFVKIMYHVPTIAGRFESSRTVQSVKS